MRVSIKGKLVIPKEVRHALGWAYEDCAADLAGLISDIQNDCPSHIAEALAALQRKHSELAKSYYEWAKEAKRG